MTRRHHYVAPQLGAEAYNCPRCGAYAQQTFSQLVLTGVGAKPYASVHQSRCAVCRQASLWFRDFVIDPPSAAAPVAHERMPVPVAQLYDEAREVAARSPRAAAGLLRHALQLLLEELEPEAARNLNAAIGRLVHGDLSQASHEPWMFSVWWATTPFTPENCGSTRTPTLFQRCSSC